MRQTLRWGAFVILAGVLVGSPAVSAQQSSEPKQTPREKQEKQDQKDRERRARARSDELGFVYKAWEDEVRDIITDEELDAFRKLSTNEEREKYIEIFWGNHDPTPDTVENEFREEHYRRIAYANERFASGVPGSKTDRGRIYIIWGEPDQIESYPAGGPYHRPAWEGGGQTWVHPFEQWRYRYMQGIGNDITIEFVDKSGTGEFRITMDPSEKDALQQVPGAGLGDLEQQGLSSKVQRFLRTDGTNLPASAIGTPARMNQFERQAQFYKVQMPPRAMRELQQEVSSRLLGDQIQFAHRFDFIRITADNVLVPVTLQIPNRELQFVSQSGIHSATLHVYGRISTLTGRTVQTFEDAIRRDIPESLFRAEREGQSIYQKPVPLRPGLYRLSVVVKDATSGDVGSFAIALPVPRFEPEQLASSTLILADRIERVPAGSIGDGPFVIGLSKVRPRINADFTADDSLGVYMQVYNLQLDENTTKPSASVRYRITREGDPQDILNHNETSEQLGLRGGDLTLEKLLPLRALAPGAYAVEIEVTDHVAGQSLTQRAKFNVNPVKQAAASGDQRPR